MFACVTKITPIPIQYASMMHLLNSIFITSYYLLFTQESTILFFFFLETWPVIYFYVNLAVALFHAVKYTLQIFIVFMLSM